MMRLVSGVLFLLVRVVLTFCFDVCFRTRTIGLERVPRSGGLLLVVNHISWFDPMIIGYATPRRVDFMAMAELFRNPVIGWLVRALGAFPVDRSRRDPGAVREAVRRLQAGRCVVIFPEGGIRLGPDSVLGGNPQFKPGAGALAMMSESTILPVVVRDTRKPYSLKNWFRFSPMSVTFGYPFCLWPDPNANSDQRREQARKTLLAACIHATILTDE